MGKKHRHKAKHEHPAKNAEPPPNHPQGEDGMVYTVRIEPHPDDGKRYADEEKYRKDQLNYAKWLNWISAAGGAVAFAALLALIVTACIVHNQLWEAKRATDLAYRPYIGVDQIKVRFYQHGILGEGTQDPTPQTDELDYTIEIKNFGPVPGLNYTKDVKTFFGKKLLPDNKVPERGITFFPGQVLSMAGMRYGPDYRAIAKGDVPLTILLTIDYDGPTGHTQECNKAQYLPDVSRFAILSSSCHAN